MKYITYKHFNGIIMDGTTADIKRGTILDCERRVLTYKGKEICVATSENAHTYFMRNDDGKGYERGDLISYILTTLATKDEKYDARWEKVFSDPICQAYRRAEHTETWLWNNAFYNTSIETLEYISNLIKGVQ